MKGKLSGTEGRWENDEREVREFRVWGDRIRSWMPQSLPK